MSNEKMKTLIKQHIITILCVLSILALFLPFAKVTAEMSMMGASSQSSNTVTGFTAAQEGILGYLLLVGPALLIAMNYVKALEKHKSLLAIAVPAVCLVVLIIVFMQAKGSAVKAAGGGGMVEMETKVSLGIGIIIAGLSYLATIVAGGVLYHNFTLDKAGLEKLKAESANFIGNAQEKISHTVQNVADRAEAAKESRTAETPTGPQSTTKKATNLNRTEEMLALIEKLSKMKDAGVLSEEEFKEKKQQLLEEI